MNGTDRFESYSASLSTEFLHAARGSMRWKGVQSEFAAEKVVAQGPKSTPESDMPDNNVVHRRHAMVGITSLAAYGLSNRLDLHAADSRPKTRMGIVAFDCGLRAKWLKQTDAGANLMEPLTFLKHCQTLGAAGMQINLGTLPQPAVQRLREYAEAHELFIEASLSPPRDRGDLARFEAEIKTAREVGALAARTVIIPGRRYEHFKNYQEFQQAERQGQLMVELAVNVVEKYQVPLAIENHKDQRIDRRLALLKHISSPYVGACIDTGNSLALLDDIYGAIEALAPYARSVHFKDQALEEYEAGFLLGDVPLGQGSFDLPRMAEIIREAQPKLQFCLEVITRDPLQVPCLSESYWQTVMEPSGGDLARMLRFVRSHTTRGQRLADLPLQEQVAIEDANIADSLAFVRQHLPQI
jgi:sugar phosphate isomerase/epimerase